MCTNFVPGYFLLYTHISVYMRYFRFARVFFHKYTVGTLLKMSPKLTGLCVNKWGIYNTWGAGWGDL